MDLNERIENVLQGMEIDSMRSREIAQLTIKIPEDLNKRLTYMSAYLDTTKLDIISSALDVFLDVCEDKYNLRLFGRELGQEQLEDLKEKYNASYFTSEKSFDEYVKEERQKSIEYRRILYNTTSDEFKAEIKKLKDSNKNISIEWKTHEGKKYEKKYPIVEDLTVEDNEK